MLTLPSTAKGTQNSEISGWMPMLFDAEMCAEPVKHLNYRVAPRSVKRFTVRTIGNHHPVLLDQDEGRDQHRFQGDN